MFTICVESGFRATHHVRLLDGTIEAPHVHDWLVRVHVSRGALDEAGMVADFGVVRTMLDKVLGPLADADLNACAALHGANPTAEVIARHIGTRLVAAGLSDLRRVDVTEAPGCTASYEPITAAQAPCAEPHLRLTM